MVGILSRARYRAVRIPGVVMSMLIVFWGVDLALRVGLHWTQMVWLFISTAVVSLITMPMLVPLTLAFDEFLRSVRAGTSIRLAAYAILFALIGAGVAFATGVISLGAAIAAGLATGLVIAKVCGVAEGVVA